MPHSPLNIGVPAAPDPSYPSPRSPTTNQPPTIRVERSTTITYYQEVQADRKDLTRLSKSLGEHHYSQGGSSRQTMVYESSQHGSKSATALEVSSPRASPHSSPRGSPSSPHPILFYDKRKAYYGFTNFSDHPVLYDGKKYPTSEHLFQSFKFQKYYPLLAEHIRTCSTRPSVAFAEARRFQPSARHDWKDVNREMMDVTLWHKFTQHSDLREELLDTGDAELIEDSPKDAFWGVGHDGRGRNELGKALMRLRDKLRKMD